MTLWWIGNILLLVAILPVVAFLLKDVHDAAKRTRAAVDALRPVARAASDDLDAVELLHTTRSQVNQTVTVVADYGGSLDQILEDA
jgi:signal transduction histidine kinase